MMDSYIQNSTASALGQLGNSKLGQIASTLESKPKDVATAAKEFESIFVAQMLQQMFKDIPTDGIFGGGHAEETWRSLLVQEYGNAVTKAGGIGIADAVQKELLGLQGV